MTIDLEPTKHVLKDRYLDYQIRHVLSLLIHNTQSCPGTGSINKQWMTGVEYNFTLKESTVDGAGSAAKEGRSHDIVPDIVWKPTKTSAVKLGLVYNVDSTMTLRDEMSIALKAFYKF